MKMKFYFLKTKICQQSIKMYYVPSQSDSENGMLQMIVSRHSSGAHAEFKFWVSEKTELHWLVVKSQMTSRVIGEEEGKLIPTRFHSNT